ncbi:hypothetical protein BGX21_009752 [Mortierella sp. AD011]|nr:hypothetical protein BGX21_009752 [Mortierella sp. AD011]
MASEKQSNKPEAQAPQLNGLEEDDEFEEFAAQARSEHVKCNVADTKHPLLCSDLDYVTIIDWNEAEEEKDSHQWDDNWDDDDIEDDFSNQLRHVDI